MEFLWFLLVYAVVCLYCQTQGYVFARSSSLPLTQIPSPKIITSFPHPNGHSVQRKKHSYLFSKVSQVMGPFEYLEIGFVCCPCISLLQMGLELYASASLVCLASFSLAPLSRMFTALIVNCLIISSLHSISYFISFELFTVASLTALLSQRFPRYRCIFHVNFIIILPKIQKIMLVFLLGFTMHQLTYRELITLMDSLIC